MNEGKIPTGIQRFSESEEKEKAISEAPAEEPAEVPKPSRRKLYIGIILVAVVINVSFLSLYVYSSQAVSGVLEQTWETAEPGGYEITDITIFPPSAVMSYMLLISNPTDYAVKISSIDLDFYLSNETTSTHVGECDISDLSLPAHSTKSININFHIGYTALPILLSDAPKTMRMVGLIEGSVAYLFFTFTQTVNVDKTITT